MNPTYGSTQPWQPDPFHVINGVVQGSMIVLCQGILGVPAEGAAANAFLMMVSVGVLTYSYWSWPR